MKCLITGAGGFIGGWLVERLLADGHTVYATDQAAPQGSFIEHPACWRAALDILDAGKVRQAFEAFKPDTVFHLAAQSYPGVSWEQPALTYEVNVLGSVHILDAARLLNPMPVTLVVCSSAEYAPEEGSAPINEDAPLQPSTPYGISKLAEDHLARLYFERYGLPAIRIRPFFLVGPRKKGDVSSDFARGIVALERGEAEDVPVGNLDVVRDMLDVRDGAAAFSTIAARGAPGAAYNICSGRGVSLREVLAQYASLSSARVRTRADPARMRPVDDACRIGDPSKLLALGWRPAIELRQSLADILEYWRGMT